MALGWYVIGLFTFLEMAACVILVLPLPIDMRRSMLQWLSTTPLMSKFRSTLYIILFILAALCTDSLREVYMTGQTLNQPGLSHEDEHIHETHYYAAQRNALLTGFALFLLILLSRFSTVVTEVFKLEQKAVILQKQAQNQEKAYEILTADFEKLTKQTEQQKEELEEAKATIKEFESKEKRNEALRQQALSQQKEYMRLMDANAELEKKVEELTSKLLQKSPQAKKDD
jgi:hypothetical protein